MTTPEIITVIKDIILAIAAATTAIVAVNGLKNWSRELKGKADFGVARNIIRATYILRDELQKCRSPFLSAYEFPHGYRGQGALKESPEEEERAWSFIYKNRMVRVWAAIRELESHAIEAEALWGKEVRNQVDQFRNCVIDLQVAIDVLFDIDALVSDKTNRNEEFSNEKEKANQIRSTVSGSLGDENNKFSKKISCVIGAIEEQIRPHLRRSK